VVLVYPVVAEQISKLVLVQAPGMSVFDVLRADFQLEPGGFQQPCDFIVIAVRCFPVDQ